MDKLKDKLQESKENMTNDELLEVIANLKSGEFYSLIDPFTDKLFYKSKSNLFFFDFDHEMWLIFSSTSSDFFLVLADYLKTKEFIQVESEHDFPNSLTYYEDMLKNQFPEYFPISQQEVETKSEPVEKSYEGKFYLCKDPNKDYGLFYKLNNLWYEYYGLSWTDISEPSEELVLVNLPDGMYENKDILRLLHKRGLNHFSQQDVESSEPQFYSHIRDVVDEILYPSELTVVQDLISNECDKIKSLLLDKNRKYGNSALEPIRIFSKSSPIEQILVRIDDKLTRIKNAQTDEDEDVISDLIGYLILLKVAKNMSN